MTTEESQLTLTVSALRAEIAVLTQELTAAKQAQHYAEDQVRRLYSDPINTAIQMLVKYNDVRHA